jgi:hypothetical protein
MAMSKLEKQVIEDCIRRGIITENEYIERMGKARLQLQLFLSDLLPLLTSEEQTLFKEILERIVKKQEGE